MRIVFLTGFLGYRTDFDEVIADLRFDFKENFEVEVVSLSSDLQYRDFQSKESTLDGLLKELSLDARPILGVGYSLGGRVLLELAHRRADLFSGVVFLSTNFGHADDQIRVLRLANDEKWAEQFLKQDWSEVMHAWNSQEVFRGSGHELQRPESNYSREQLAWVLREFSLGRQKDFRKDVLDWKIPQLYFAGARDKKYTGMLENLSGGGLTSGGISIEIVPEAGHRVYLDQPAVISKRVAEFARQLSLYSEPKSSI